MTKTPTWQPIATAPRDGTPCLLFDRALERNAHMPRDRRVHNAFAVVGRWHVIDRHGDKSDWVTDIGAIDHEGEQPFWDACVVEPTHWAPLPNAPPDGQWVDIRYPPTAFEYVLLQVPGLNQMREYPMAMAEADAPASDMVVGCCVDDPQAVDSAWLTDLCEMHQLGGDPEDLGVEAARVSPAYWMALPPPANDA